MDSYNADPEKGCGILVIALAVFLWVAAVAVIVFLLWRVNQP